MTPKLECAWMEARGTWSHKWDIPVLLLLFLATLLFCIRGSHGETSIVFQLGPNDHSYISGFATHYEVTDEVATRWTTYDAGIDIPLALEGGPIEISYRFSRVFPETAEVAVSLNGATVDRFNCRGGEIQTRRVRLPALSTSTPLDIGLIVDSHERKNLGLRLDWVRIDVGENGRVQPRGWARWCPPLLSAFLFLLFRWGGLARASSALAVGAWIAVVAIWMHSDPHGFSHVVRHIRISAMVLSVMAAVVLRRLPAGRWVIPIFVLGYLLRASALFYPTTFYPDVANARDYVEVFRETSGSLAERGVETQTLTNVGYPRNVGGKNYAFPYSPLYFLPFGAFSTPGAIEDAVRHVGVAAASLAVLPLFWLGLTILGARAGVVATFLWAFMPPIFSRLLLALHATVVGNFLDLLVIASVLALALDPGSRRRTALVAVTTLVSLLVYTSSLFSVSAFFLFMSLLNRRLAPRLIAVLFVCGVVTVGWLYWPFLLAFFTEILPALASGGGSPPADSSSSPWVAIGRIPLFYGYLYPLLVAAGIALAHRHADRTAFRLLVAYGLAFLFMLGLRAFGAGIFKDLKEITFVAPLVAILSAAALDALSRRERWGWAATASLIGALTWFGVSRYRGYLETYATPVTSAIVSDANSSAVVQVQSHPYP